MLELIINNEKDLKNIMLVENGVLIERHQEHKDKKRLEGNIYVGKVKEVLPGMQSAFIDIGEGKNTFIRLKDLLPKVDETKESINGDIKIHDIIKKDDKVMVQIKRDETMKKGARVSTHINLSGRFVVLLPECNIVTISQKLEEDSETERILKILEGALPNSIGAILRTSSKGIPEELIIEDLGDLIKKWKKIKKDYNEHTLNGPKILYDNKALMRRTLMDIVDQKLDKVIVNNKKTFKDVEDILKNMNAENKVSVELKENENLLEKYELSNQIERIDNRKIWLKCGGFITIDKTEALTAIDVNTGKFTGKEELEETVLEVNKQATVEIAKQLRLRDIGGIIIIDYIDMQRDQSKETIVKTLEECLMKDRTKNQVIGFTKLNLLEMTRKNMCNNDNF